MEIRGAYSYQSPLKAWEPFKNADSGSEWSSIITDLNLMPLLIVSIRADLDRTYRYTQFRTLDDDGSFTTKEFCQLMKGVFILEGIT